MKKLSRILAYLFLICMILTIFAACNSFEIVSEPVGKLTAEQVSEIRKDYLDYYFKGSYHSAAVDLIHVRKYLGTYSGNIAIEIVNENYDRDLAPDSKLVVDGIEIGSFGANNEFWLYLKGQKDVKFISFQSAFDGGYLSHEDLIQIVDYYVCANG